MSRIPVSALVGLLFTGAFLFLAIFAPWVAPYGTGDVVGDVWGPMTAKHWLGTDKLPTFRLSDSM